MTVKKDKEGLQGFKEGAALLLASSVLVKLIGALFKIPLSSDYILGDIGFGYFSFAYDLYTPIYTLAATGLPIVVSRLVAEAVAENRFCDTDNVFKSAKKLFWGVGIAGFFVLLLLIFLITALTDSTGKVFYSLLSLPVLFLLSCLISVYRGYYEGLQNMKPTAVSNVLEAVCKLIFGLLLAFLTLKLTKNPAYAAAAAMLGIALSSLISLCFLALYFKKNCVKTALNNSKADSFNQQIILKSLALIAIPVVVTSLSSSFSGLIDALTVKPLLYGLFKTDALVIKDMYSSVIAHNFSNSTATALLYGIKGKAYTISNLIPTFTAAFAIGVVPNLSRYWTSGDHTQVKNTVNTALLFTGIITLPAGLGMLSVGKGIMSFLYSSVASVEIGGGILSIYGLATIFLGFAIPLTAMLVAIGCEFKALKSIVIGAALKLVLNILLIKIPQLNIYGCAISTVISYAVMFVLCLIYLIKSLHFKPNFLLVFLKPLLAAALSAATAFAITYFFGGSNTVFLIALLLAVLVYLFAVVLTGAFTKDDLINIKSINNSK